MKIHIDDFKRIIAAALDLEKAIDEAGDKKDVKDHMRLTVAANLLHDVDAEMRKKFLTDYEKIREEVKEVCGEAQENN